MKSPVSHRWPSRMILSMPFGLPKRAESAPRRRSQAVQTTRGVGAQQGARTNAV